MLLGYEDLAFKKYEGEDKKVVLSGKEYRAFFPKEHSVLDGIVFDVRDTNPYAGTGGAIPWEYTECFVLKRGEKEWKQFYSGDADGFSIGDIKGETGCGLYRILVQFESDEVKEKIEKRNLIRELQGRIKGNSLQLRRDVKMLKELL